MASAGIPYEYISDSLRFLKLSAAVFKNCQFWPRFMDAYSPLD